MFDKRRFLAQLKLQDLTMEELARKIGMNPTTLYRKINDDGRFSRKELSAIAEVFGKEHMVDIFFANSVA